MRTRVRGWRIAINAAMKNVLSPISLANMTPIDLAVACRNPESAMVASNWLASSPLLNSVDIKLVDAEKHQDCVQNLHALRTRPKNEMK